MVTATGLKARPRKDGTTAYYWVASSVSKNAENYPSKTIRLFGTDDEIATLCRQYTRDLREWLSERGAGEPEKFNGTLGSLIDVYRSTAESPYFEIKSNTRTMYDESLDLLKDRCGGQLLEDLTGIEIRRWYNNFKTPAADTEKQAAARAEAAAMGVTLPPNPERVRRAYKTMQLLRVVIGFGVVSNTPECPRLKKVLEEMRFKSPKPRTAYINFEQARAICDIALKNGKPSIALAQALQFELTLRQIDVIGRWEKTDSPEDGGIVDRGRRWRDGLLWSHLDANGLLFKTTSKTEQEAAHNTMAYPFLREMVDHIPAEKRFGPMIRCETTGLPYRYRHFSKLWREIATEAGVPNNVWNRDTRAGGITEGGDAGIDIELLRHQANHQNIATTQRYNRKTLAKTQKVAELRVANRSPQNASGTDG
jgi:integrase